MFTKRTKRIFSVLIFVVLTVQSFSVFAQTSFGCPMTNTQVTDTSMADSSAVHSEKATNITDNEHSTHSHTDTHAHECCSDNFCSAIHCLSVDLSLHAFQYIPHKQTSLAANDYSFSYIIANQTFLYRPPIS